MRDRIPGRCHSPHDPPLSRRSQEPPMSSDAALQPKTAAHAKPATAGAAGATVPQKASEAELVARLAQARTQVLEEMQKVIVGQREVLEQLILAVLCRGHCLLEGVPGL